MTREFDAIVVGSGPAGVSASFPLLAAGLQVLLVDGGRDSRVAVPAGPFLSRRADDPEQWVWMVGRDYHTLRSADAASPKLRVPTHQHVFADFAAENRVHSESFIAVGSLARGGLSNAWGCGIARFSADELRSYPFPPAQIAPSYEAVARRIGISGAHADEMADYFGVDAWAQAPVPIGALQSWLFARHAAGGSVRLGRSRLAVLSEDRGERQACDLSGTCLWGCRRRALYSAVDELALLGRYPGFHYRPGFVVDGLAGSPALRTVTGRDGDGPGAYRARRVILAAGTLASTRLALQALDHRRSVPLQACPTAAFLLWVPRFLGRRRQAEFGLGQLSYAVSLDDGITGFGSLFNSTGIPLFEFARYLPLRKRYGVDFLSALLGSCAVGNLFLPGYLTQASLTLGADAALKVEGAYDARVTALMRLAERRLRAHFRKLGALLLPRSFTVGRPGSDIHYSCSLPMRSAPRQAETTADGELVGLEAVHVVDGASLSRLSEKSHTLTIMANADRIGRSLATTLRRND